MGGFPTALDLHDIKLIEAGLAYVDRDSSTIGDLGPVRLDETLAHCGLSAGRRKEMSTHTQNLSRWATANDTLGRQWESQFAWGVMDTFGDDFAELGKLLVFHEPFKWLEQRKFRLIAVQNVLGDYVATKVSWDMGPCVQLGFYAHDAPSLCQALKDGGGTTFFFPDNNFHPDMVFHLLE